jgi:cell division protein FtsI (penicillin-binding protein 3)
MKNKLHSSYHKRVTITACLIFSFFSLLIIQFYRIQIIEGERWSKEALIQHEFSIKTPFKRGRFFTNPALKLGHIQDPKPFVIDIPVFHLHIDPLSIPQDYRDEVANKLMEFLGLPRYNYKKVRSLFDRRSRDRRVSFGLSKSVKTTIKQWWRSYARRNKIARNAIFFIDDYQRSYPYGKLLGQVLHTIRDTKDSISKQGIPTGGLEYHFNDHLKGERGVKRLLRSPRHPMETSNIIKHAQDGADIYLTIDHYLQTIAEEELAKGIDAHEASSGFAIIMAPKNGEVLAMAQYPFFHPSNYQEYYNTPERIKTTKCKPISDTYEPASTMKPITLALCLKANKILQQRNKPPLFYPKEKIATDDGRFPGRSRPLVDGRRHDFLNMYMALQKSSNVYMGKVIHKTIGALGTEWYRKELIETFGFGKRTDIELPAESPGRVPRPGVVYPNGTLEWSKGTPYSLAIGHNIQVNSLQMLRAFSCLANGGYLVKPTLVKKIEKHNTDGTTTTILDNTTPERVASFPRVLDEDIITEVVKAMNYVTKYGGTASRANISGYTETGKTGTAKKIVSGTYSDKYYFSTFIGFTPVNNPQFVILIAVDSPKVGFIKGKGKIHHGGYCAAPMFRAIGQRALEYIGAPPDDPHGYPHGDPRYEADKAHWVQETRMLRKKYDEWNT